MHLIEHLQPQVNEDHLQAERKAESQQLQAELAAAQAELAGTRKQLEVASATEQQLKAALASSNEAAAKGRRVKPAMTACSLWINSAAYVCIACVLMVSVYTVSVQMVVNGRKGKQHLADLSSMGDKEKRCAEMVQVAFMHISCKSVHA